MKNTKRYIKLVAVDRPDEYGHDYTYPLGALVRLGDDKAKELGFGRAPNYALVVPSDAHGLSVTDQSKPKAEPERIKYSNVSAFVLEEGSEAAWNRKTGWRGVHIPVYPVETLPVDDTSPPAGDLAPLPEQASKRRVTRKLDTEETVTVIGAPENHQLDYEVRTKCEVITAKKIEAELLENNILAEAKEPRAFARNTVDFGAMRTFRETRNLIEAKSSSRREHIRMAVRQLLDYAFQGRKKLGDSNKAILLPKKPNPAAVKWLEPLKIKIIWRDGARL